MHPAVAPIQPAGRLRTGKRLFGSIAGTIIVLLLAAGGCAIPGGNRCERDTADIESARRCFVQGDYRCAGERIQRFLATGAGKPGYDRALHLAAMNCLFSDTAADGDACAVEYLQRLVLECPASPLLPEAALWIALLGDLARHRQEAEEAQQVLGRRMREIRTLQKSIERCQTERDAGQRDLQRLQHNVSALQKKIKELEKVDVQFFQRKKDFGDDTE